MNPLPLAFGFANLAMLGWLGAAAAPILIHLWMRQTHRETVWAAVRFLQAALEKQARRLRLQHFILLALRTLLLILIALAAAKPLLDSGILGAGAPTHRVLVLDASLSMKSLNSEGLTALERAKRIATEVIDASRAGDTYSLVVMGAGATAPLGRPTADASAARRAIETVQPTQGVANLGAALIACQQLVEAAAETRSNQRQDVLLLSDLGANTWRRLTAGDGETNAAAEAYAALAESASVSAIDLGGSTLPNAAVTSFALGDRLPTLSSPVELRGEVALFGGAEGDRTVELLIDDQVVDQQRVKLTPGVSAGVDFLHRFEEAGPRRVALRIAGGQGANDRLRDDDTRWLALALQQRLKVLCVAGAPGAVDYLADALDPTGEGAFEPVTVSDADLPTVDLNEYACVFLSNVREFSESEAQRLLNYVEMGGGVAVFLGDRVSPQRYNDRLAPDRRPDLGDEARTTHRPPMRLVALGDDSQDDEGNAGGTSPDAGATSLMPGWLSASVAAPSYGVDPLEYEHPIVAPFRGWERAGLLTTPVMRHFPIEVDASQQARVALALENGDPLLVTGVVGRGRTAVLTTAATLASVDPATGQPWTAMPAWPSFLPIVRGLVRHLAGDAGVGQSLLIDEPILGVSAKGEEITVEPPGADAPSRIGPDAGGGWVYAATNTAGVYRYGTPGQTISAAAVNVDSGESDAAPVDAKLLPESLTVRRSLGNAASDAAGAAPTPLHRWLLCGALAIALIEPALACWFGRSGG